MKLVVPVMKQLHILWPKNVKNPNFCGCSCLLISFIPLCRFLFWTEKGVVIRLNLAHGFKVTLVTYLGEGGAIKLDCSKKRVYWLENSRSIVHINSCNYRGGKKKTLRSGSIDKNLLGVLGDLLFFVNTNEHRINVMNVSNGNISQTIVVEWEDYQDLLVVDKSVQPTCEYNGIIICVGFKYLYSGWINIIYISVTSK